jgi:hypothetical protein
MEEIFSQLNTASLLVQMRDLRKLCCAVYGPRAPQPLLLARVQLLCYDTVSLPAAVPNLG